MAVCTRAKLLRRSRYFLCKCLNGSMILPIEFESSRVENVTAKLQLVGHLRRVYYTVKKNEGKVINPIGNICKNMMQNLNRDVHYQSFFRMAPRQTNKQIENKTDVKYQTLELILH